jgi:hypothetical protein
MTAEQLPTTHVLIHARDALTTDPRVGELGLDLEEEAASDGSGGPVVAVRGWVSTDDRKSGVVPVVREVLQAHGLDFPVRDETEVPEAKVPDGGAEEL